METYTITGDQWQKINSALNVAISVCMMHKREFMQDMIDASETMDVIVNGEPEEDELDADILRDDRDERRRLEKEDPS